MRDFLDDFDFFDLDFLDKVLGGEIVSFRLRLINAD